MAATVERAAYIAGTFDTKGRELFFLRNCLEKLGLRTVTVDLATSGKPSPAMIHPREVARHHPKGERAVFTGDRGSAVSEMAVAFERFVTHRRDLGGLISAGGSGGTALATLAMRGLPIGLPKVMVSTVASGDVKPYVGPSDICMMYSVTDVAGINRISERVLANAAHALAGMIAYGRARNGESSAKPAIGLTQFGVTTPCVQAVTKALEERYDCLVFHATGTGGQSMEKLVDSGLLAGVIDVTTTEIADEIVGGVLSAGPARLDAIIRTRLPYVGSCGALDMANFWAMDTVPARFREPQSLPAQPQRHPHAHDSRRMRAHRPLHRREAQPDGGPGAVPDPRRRRLADRRAGPGVLGSRRRSGAVRRDRDRLSRGQLPEARPPAAQHQRPGLLRRAGGRLRRDRRPPRRRPAAGEVSPPMPRISRQDCLKKFRAMIRRGEPIIGGGAGTGLSAKCEEAGGIDLIVIYNSGRYRMAGRGSLAGLMAYGNANDIVLDMAREVLPVVKRTPVLAGVNGTDPFMITDDFLRRLIELGFSGVQNFPTVGLFDGTIRAQLEETGMGYGLEVEMIRAAHERDLLTTPYVFSEQNAVDMAKAGADIVVCHLGLTAGGAIGAETALKLKDCVPLVDAWAAAARSVNKDVIVLCHGGPIARPADARYILKNCRQCHGFYGASSMERLPTEVALTETTRKFKKIRR